MKGLIDGRRGGIPHRSALIAQLVEHLICNQGVPGSSPGGGTIKSIISMYIQLLSYHRFTHVHPFTHPPFII